VELAITASVAFGDLPQSTCILHSHLLGLPPSQCVPRVAILPSVRSIWFFFISLFKNESSDDLPSKFGICVPG